MKRPDKWPEKKVCTKCHVEKPWTEYGRHTAGLMSPECRVCHNKRTREQARTPAGREARRRAEKRYKETHPEKRARDWQKRDYWKERARDTLRHGIFNGTVNKPDRCQECSRPGLIHGHHNDYKKRREVEWLCPECHGKRHRKYA